jgi:hypothetical protein
VNVKWIVLSAMTGSSGSFFPFWRSIFWRLISVSGYSEKKQQQHIEHINNKI